MQYSDVELLDTPVARDAAYAIYIVFTIAQLLLSTNRDVRIFGELVFATLAITYLFFSFACISVFCIGAHVALSRLNDFSQAALAAEGACGPEVRLSICQSAGRSAYNANRPPY